MVGEVIPVSSVIGFKVLMASGTHAANAGRLAEAKASLAKLEEHSAAKELPLIPEGCWLELLKADVELLEGNLAAAKRRAEVVIKAYGDVTNDVDPLRARAVMGLVALEEGKAKEAAELLRATLKSWEGVAHYAGNRARAHFALARALVKSRGDLAEARRHALAAREEYARCGFTGELKAIDAWLATAVR
jgi:hypothetical protein